jgi:hypothetical protein
MPASPHASPSPGQLAKLVLAAGLAATWSTPAQAGPPLTPSVAAAAAGDASMGPGNLDVLFMIDDSSSMASMQQKLAAQIPSFVSALEALPGGLPDIHIAVVSSDLGAPGDSTTALGCTTVGDDGRFLVGASSLVGGSPSIPGTGGTLGGVDAGASGCPGLAPGATFISNVGGVANYTGDLATVLGCMTALGDKGCGFEHQIASVARALGADGSPMPPQNAGFLRPDAELAIIFLSNEDDCSAPPSTLLYSLNVGGSGQQNIQNALGPVGNYRCNAFGHLCVDPAAAGQACQMEPPLEPPADAQQISGTPTVSFTNCVSAEDDGLLTPLVDLVAGIRALKTDPDNQIVVGAIAAPAAPYTVQWIPEQGGQNTRPGELWPLVDHSCGPMGGDDVNPAGQLTTDGSFGDPSVRLAQFVRAFGGNGVSGSICDATYAGSVGTIVSRIGARLQPGGGGVDGGAVPPMFPLCPAWFNPGGVPGAVGAVTAGDGLHGGCGCDVGGPGAGALGLGVLTALLALAWRRRAAAWPRAD